MALSVGENVGHLPEEDPTLGADGDDALLVGRDLGHDDGAGVSRALEVLRALVVVPELDLGRVEEARGWA